MEMDERIRTYFDLLGEAEWDRLDSTPRSRVSLEVHRRFLAGYVAPGARVLEIGAGPGRFTIELARVGATVVVTDVSEVQLELNERHVAEAGCEESVESRGVLDVRNLDRFAEDEFDLVLAFGGPLSYVFEDAGAALENCLRTGRVVVGSVMSTLGAWRLYLPQVIEIEDEIGEAASTGIVTTGDLRLEGKIEGHVCKMYRPSELTSLVERAGGAVLSMSSSNWASLGDEDALAELESDHSRWSRFLALETEACREPGIVGAGTHILFAAKAGA